MSTYTLKIKLLSDTTFGRGDGVAGLVDQEVEHDRYGFPYLRGRTLKGLLSEECDNLIAVLPDDNQRHHWQGVADCLFGKPGSTLESQAKIHVGDACLPGDLRHAIAAQLDREQERQKNGHKPNLTSTDIRESLTTIRRQTAINPENGTPTEHSLRSARVILRELPFESKLLFETELNKDSEDDEDMLALLAVGTLALRRMGSGRNRGRGHVQCSLHDSKNDITKDMNYIERFGRIR
ncbi:RAMP superfamily CRISPR-associated protein [Limnoraphis robusta]|uniref:RAMP superfamily CRISPR-associated protein n=1 Tax=Limnoraphis robusta CCNP1315 TaxID=3110306 RepID=A0ABU5TVR9_9CYAN|nr:RAMP superfamily CRISPR-associated protein [Limnoraphis robusta]MEA5519001.1 RAMP superfamily CRISPR-associated protein [Limnoraphis robusta CCNP1315]MEA5544027.1 RAMP superfamily CRISPR-associated protein [Limnoraphis robusta CCNP1324]